MASIKQTKIRIIACSLLTIFALSLLHFSLASAEPEPNDPEKVMLDNISQNCASIKQSLNQLQRSDSRTRTYLGTAFQNISANFIAPLASRLAKNNLENDSLSNIQTEFTSTLNSFRSSYTDYMRELESLIATDCQAHPEDFYQQLQRARTSRATLSKHTAKLTSLTDQQIKAVEALIEPKETP